MNHSQWNHSNGIFQYCADRKWGTLSVTFNGLVSHSRVVSRQPSVFLVGHHHHDLRHEPFATCSDTAEGLVRALHVIRLKGKNSVLFWLVWDYFLFPKIFSLKYEASGQSVLQLPLLEVFSDAFRMMWTKQMNRSEKLLKVSCAAVGKGGWLVVEHSLGFQADCCVSALKGGNRSLFFHSGSAVFCLLI